MDASQPPSTPSEQRKKKRRRNQQQNRPPKRSRGAPPQRRRSPSPLPPVPAPPFSSHNTLPQVPPVPEGSVVKVITKCAEPNYTMPWSIRDVEEGFGTSFVIDVYDRRLLLTNSHVIRNHLDIKVVRSDSDEFFVAAVEFENACCDLALLSVGDAKFWLGLKPIPFLSTDPPIPRLQSQVNVLGYATGGKAIAFSRGVVKRMEMKRYDPGFMKMLVIHTDASIYSGQSGGPALDNEGKCIGVAFTSTTDSPSYGSVVPSVVVNQFLRDFSKSDHNGFVELGFRFQKLNSGLLRAELGMRETETGILVKQGGLTAAELKGGDVVLFFGNYAIGNDAMIEFYEGQRISFTYLLTAKSRGEPIKLYVLSEGHRKYVTIYLQPMQRLVPPYISKSIPSYFLLGGIVFTASTLSYIRELRNRTTVRHTPPSLEMIQEVRISMVFDTELTKDFNIKEGVIVSQINGSDVKCLQSLIDTIKGTAEENLKFLLDCDYTVILNRSEVLKQTLVVMKKYSILLPAQAIWKDLTSIRYEGAETEKKNG